VSKELVEKCIEYGITGEAKDFLEGMENVFDKVSEEEKEANEEVPTMYGWIKENIDSAGLEGFTDEQKFFFGIGVLSSELMNGLN